MYQKTRICYNWIVNEEQPGQSIDALVEEAFPYVRVRTMLDILSECIVQQRSLDKVLSRPEFQDFDINPMAQFHQEVTRRFNTLQSRDVQDGYRNFWLRVWDVVVLDRALSAGAEGFPDPDSTAAGIYKAMTEWDSPFTQETRKQGQQLLVDGRYKELSDLILDREIERNRANQAILPSTDQQAGLHIAYGDSLIFLSSVVGQQPPQE